MTRLVVNGSALDPRSGFHSDKEEAMKNLVIGLMILSILLAAAPGCFVFHHQVGKGSQTGHEKSEGQWFILWGLVPLGKVDSHALAGSATDYTITTQFTVLDVIISAFTSWITIYKQTVIVEK